MSSTTVSPTGVEGDREFGLIDVATGMPAAPERDKRWRKALELRASCIAEQYPSISFPNGHLTPVNDPSLSGVLSDYFGFAAAVAAYNKIGAHAGFPLTQHRHHFYAVHVLTTSSINHLAQLRQIETIDRRRFRPTVLIETGQNRGFLENDWTGRHLQLGSVELFAHEKTKRCGVTFISQPEIEEDPEILRTILRYNQRNLGIYCSIEIPGTIEVGDELFV